MTYDDVKAYLEPLGLKPMRFDESSATVALAAQAVGCEPCRIAKTMAFMVDGKPALIVLAGDTRVDNPKFKARFHQKAVMLPPDTVAELTGFPPGGVCPFLVPDGIPVYLDEALKRFDTVYPAAGSRDSAVEVPVGRLEAVTRAAGWVEISKMAGAVPLHPNRE